MARKSRCSKGSRKCFTGQCRTKNSTKRATRCTKGMRQCADRECYKFIKYNLRRRKTVRGGGTGPETGLRSYDSRDNQNYNN